MCIHMNGCVHVRMHVQHCMRQRTFYEVLHLYSVGDGPNIASEEYPLGFHDNSLSKQPQRSALTGRDSNAGRDADAVVNDSEHVDVVLYACFQA